jgi:hypothetical protein
MTFPVDRLGLINNALSLCGDNQCATAEDGSDEWNVASASYEAAIEYMLDAHDWKGITAFATLARSGDSTDGVFTDAYAKPADCVHLISVTVNDIPVEYRLIGNRIVLSANGSTVKIKYVSDVGSSLEDGGLTRTFMVALLCFVRAGIYGGLHEDISSEARLTAQARQILAEAKTRSDQEQPKRAMFSSRLRLSRRIPRPWPSSPPGWGR